MVSMLRMIGLPLVAASHRQPGQPGPPARLARASLQARPVRRARQPRLIGPSSRLGRSGEPASPGRSDPPPGSAGPGPTNTVCNEHAVRHDHAHGFWIRANIHH